MNTSEIAPEEGDGTETNAPSGSEGTGAAAATAAPENDNPAGQRESAVPGEYTAAKPPVDPEIPDADGALPARPDEETDAGDAAEIRIPNSDIDLDAIAIDQDFEQMVSVKSESAAPPIRKPGKQLWFSPHPDQTVWRSFLTIKDESDMDTVYIVPPTLTGELQGEYAKTLLVPCMTQQGTVFFWPINLPGEDGRVNSWNQSSLEIAVSFGGGWLRLRSNQSASAYDTLTPKTPPPPPEWPEDISDLLRRAIKKVFISDLEHPLVKRLLGE